MIDTQLMMEFFNYLLIFGHSNKLLNHLIPLSNMKLWHSKVENFPFEIYPYHTDHSQHVHFYHMLTILNFIPCDLPKVLTCSSIYLGQRGLPKVLAFSPIQLGLRVGATSLHRNLCLGLPNFIYFCVFSCDGPMKLTNS